MNKTPHQGNPDGGFKRIINAGCYSAAGLKVAIKHERSFQQELLISLIMIPALLFLPVPVYLKWFVFFSHILVLVTELLNSAVEAVVDMVSPDYHELAKRAKDLGSAAVLLTLILTTSLWLYVLFSTFY